MSPIEHPKVSTMPYETHRVAIMLRIPVYKPHYVIIERKFLSEVAQGFVVSVNFDTHFNEV